MLDATLRRRLTPALSVVARQTHALGFRAGHITAIKLVVGIGACVAAAVHWWEVALVAWLVNRALDGLDGAVARIQGSSDLGGLLDFTADFVVYAGFMLAVAIAETDARVAACFLLSTYLLNNVVLLSLASLIEKRSLGLGDERSLRFTPALTEGTETIAAYTLICVLPGDAAAIAWIFGALVLVSVAQRLVLARQLLSESAQAGRAASTEEG